MSNLLSSAKESGPEDSIARVQMETTSQDSAIQLVT